jgi:XTP/dITP diphosphohydrolase
MNNNYQQILIASNNYGKITEITELLNQIKIQAISPLPFNLVEPEETALTFAENSLIKAKYYSSNTNLPALADDSGLCIDLLNGNPGIHSARYAINPKNNQKDFNYAFEKIFFELKKHNITNDFQAKAYFICDLCFFDPNKNFYKNFQGRVDGTICLKAKGNNGFGYDPIFIKDQMKQTFGEIAKEQKEKISHRNHAFHQFASWLKNSS